MHSGCETKSRYYLYFLFHLVALDFHFYDTLPHLCAWYITCHRLKFEYFIFVKENLRVDSRSREIESPLELPLVKNFNFDEEIWTDRSMIREPYLCSPVSKLFYAFPQP